MRSLILLISILILGTLLRFYTLGSNPPSLDWDEASLGYNAYSILKTGRDEYGNFLPLSIRSFDDYKPPAYVYLTVPSVALFGLNEFSTRLPSAVLGLIGVIFVYFLTKEIFLRQKLSLVVSLLMAISPWSLQFSRAAFEGNVGLTFLLGGLYFLFRSLKKSRNLFFALPLLVFSLYSYHSFRVITPILVLAFFLLNRPKINVLKSVIFCLVLGLAALPILASLGSRFSMVTLISAPEVINQSLHLQQVDSHSWTRLLHGQKITALNFAAKGYLDHFNFDFLFLVGDSGNQHHAVDMGMLYLFEFPFILAGLYFLVRSLRPPNLFLLLFLLASPLPSAITTGTPHAVRAIAMLFPLHLLTSLGINKFIKKPYLVLTLSLLVTLSLFSYLDLYHLHTPQEYALNWQYGYKELFRRLSTKDANISRVVVTYRYDQPYIYYLFYNRIDPAWYQSHWDYQKNGQVDRMVRFIGKYEFRNIDWAKEKQQKNTIIAGTPKEIPLPGENILLPSGEPVFKIVKL